MIAEEHKKKLNAVSHIISIVMAILFIVCTIAVILILILLALVALNPKFATDFALHASMSVGGLEAAIITSLTIGIFSVLLTATLYDLFASIRKGNTPFTSRVIKDIEKLAILLLAMFPVIPIVSFLSTHILATGETPFIQINMMILLAAGIVYCLSIVFRYGSVLQKESDETL